LLRGSQRLGLCALRVALGGCSLLQHLGEPALGGADGFVIVVVGERRLCGLLLFIVLVVVVLVLRLAVAVGVVLVLGLSLVLLLLRS